jgi:Mrp family chromosome partitioning ATPase
MRGGRRKLPVLAEISGPAPGEARAWSLRRTDLEALAKLQGGLDDRRAVLVVGEECLVGAIALAGAASAAGRRAALVECDLARPRLAVELGLSPGPGLHEYLRWEAAAPEILQPLVLAGPAARGASDPLVSVVAGRPAADAATLVKLESFRHALAKLRAAYDLVVMIGPPLEIVRGTPEAIAAHADAVLAAAPAKGLSGQPRRLLAAQLQRLPAETLGAIAIEPDPGRS